MPTLATIRRTCMIGLAYCFVSALLFAQERSMPHVASMPVQMTPLGHPAAPPPPSQTAQRNQEHLAQWMERHRGLTPAQQQRALEQEPGFHQLPQPMQERMLQRLNQLNAMPAGQRSHMLERAEQMEHLTPPQRQQLRSAMARLGALPLDRRRVVARAFRDLREMTPQQRQAALNSSQFLNGFSPEERSTLSNLMTVEPLLPPQQPAH